MIKFNSAKVLALAVAIGTGLTANAGEYLIKYKNEKAVNNMISMESVNSGLEVKGLHKAGRLVKVNVSEKNKARVLANILSDKNVEYAVPNLSLKHFLLLLKQQH